MQNTNFLFIFIISYEGSNITQKVFASIWYEILQNIHAF